MELYFILGILMLPAILFSFIASSMVTTRFNRYAKDFSSRGMTGAQVARMLLDREGLTNIKIVRVKGKLTDYYSHSEQLIALSDATIDSCSIAAIGVASHEVGHAIQYARGYMPIKIRMGMFPMMSICNKFLMPVTILALIFGLFYLQGPLGTLFAAIGLTVFGISMVYSLFTIPVELDASRRAKAVLRETDVLSKDELKKSAKVLTAAAMTYFAAFLISLVSFLRIAIVIYSAQKRRR